MLAFPSVARLQTVVSRVPPGTHRLHPRGAGQGPARVFGAGPSHSAGVGGPPESPNRRDGPAGGRRLAASRSVTHPTRLETRTKESNMCASQWVLNRPMGAMKAKDRRVRSEWGSPAFKMAGAHPRPVLSGSPVGRSLSVHVGTRKMVNYARAGRGQRKLWWRSAAVLTCKSIVRSGSRGERLIEPSSSWFPPKFPSG